VQETITIRPKRPKAELVRAAGGNLNNWINGLIEAALGPRPEDCKAHFDRPSTGRKFRHEGVDAVRAAGRR
jgi:hypothetical protein